jgi:autotransporter passenger strand-loop-strand repeat protein
MNVLSGGIAGSTTISDGGFEIVAAGGTDLIALISGGEQDVSGHASGTAVFIGSQVVETGGTTTNTNLSGGFEIVSPGGTAIVTMGTLPRCSMDMVTV